MLCFFNWTYIYNIKVPIYPILFIKVNMYLIFHIDYYLIQHSSNNLGRNKNTICLKTNHPSLNITIEEFSFVRATWN